MVWFSRQARYDDMACMLLYERVYLPENLVMLPTGNVFQIPCNRLSLRAGLFMSKTVESYLVSTHPIGELIKADWG